MSFPYHNSNLGHVSHIDGAGFGKVAIITGCASGIGLATTQTFLSHQYQVFGVDVNSIDYAKIDESHQGRFHFHKGDLTEEGECDKVVRICVAEFGERIDVLANVAGVMDAFEAADVFTDPEWDRVLMVNLTVPTRMIRAVLPFMKAKKSGSIINVASKAATSGAVAGLAYTTSKHGLLGVTKHTAFRFRNDGIRCNAVLPGAVDTNIAESMKKENFDQESYAQTENVVALHNPIGQKPAILGQDVANLILFLVSDAARAINGASVPIDKAWSVI